MKKLVLCLPLLAFFSESRAQNWSEDVASILYNNCTVCHHTGGIGNMPLMTYDDAFAFQAEIELYVSNGWMPPWIADTSFQHYYDERTLTTYERTTILDWIAGGSPEGDAGLAPPPPVYNGSKILPGTPDLTVQMMPYMSKATMGDDDYVCISLPSGLLEDKKLKAMEVIPGNYAAVHHVLVYHDADGSYGTDTVGGNCSGPTSEDLLGGYAPGSQPTIYPSSVDWESGMQMLAGAQIVLAMHYPHGSYGEWDSTKVNFYFYEEPMTAFREVYSYPLIANMTFTIGAETIDTVEDQFSIPSDLTFISALPHMHKLGMFIETYGLSGGVDTVPMVRIPQWDFDWQDIYCFEYLLPLMTGDDLYGRGIFDNTSLNPNNPNDPPVDVSWGLNTTDEMFLVYYAFMTYQAGDEYISQDSLNTIFMSEELEKFEDPLSGIMVYPNPFEAEVSISYQLTNAGIVNIYLYDTRGRVVRRLLRGEQQSQGTQVVKWDGKDEKGVEVSRGLYYYSMTIDGAPFSGRIVKK